MRLFQAGALSLALASCPSPAIAADCADLDAWERHSYRNERFGFGFDYPSIFRLDPGSVPADRSSARFWTPDRRATAVVNAAPNRDGRSLRDLLREAEGDVLHNSRGEITYRRIRDDWFVISG